MRLFLRWIALLGALMAGGFTPSLAAVTDYPFRLLTKAGDGEYVLIAQNDGPAPVTVHVTLSGENYASDRTWPATIVVPRFTALPLGRVYAADEESVCSFDLRYTYRYGRTDAKPDANAVYRLPFENGKSFPVTQAMGGTATTHDNPGNRYAVDFAMPVGTRIVAARSGTVVDVTLKHQEGGYDKRFADEANIIAILHDDGTVAEYAHLSPGPALVKAGQRVQAGQIIGYSGNTGYSSGPHLHFNVSRPAVVNGKVRRLSVPVTFYVNNPAVHFSAVQGSTVTANYGSTPAVARRTSEPLPTATGLTSLDD